MANQFEKLIHPVTEFRFRDLLQVITGAALLSIPVGFTEESWMLGQSIPLFNIIAFVILSFVFIALFSYYHYHGHLTEKKWEELAKRTFATYIFSFIVVGFLLYLIEAAPWTTDFTLALKRTILVTFPASLSGALVDTLK